MKFKALVLGVDDRSALTVIRSLGRKGVEVHLGKDVPRSICTDSRYVHRVMDMPSAGTAPSEWIEALAGVLSRERYDLVIPTADNYLVLAVKHRARLENLAKFAIPDDRGFEYTYNKSKTLELAKELAVPCPRTCRVSRVEDIEAVLQDFRLPVILKPISSKVWQQNTRHALDVELATATADLRQKLTRLLPICPVLVQTFHPGIGVGQEFLMNRGVLVAAFQHERVHEPLGGGGSSYRKSVAIDPELLRHSLNLLQALEWTGVAMVEYKQNKATGESVLMEINGRFWGSLPLAVAAGVDFPGLLFDMLVQNKFPDKVAYRENLYARNPVKDLDWLKENIRADKNDPFKITVPMPVVLAEVRHLLRLRERWDTLTWDDPRPGLKQLTAYLAENLRGARDKLHRRWVHFNYRHNFLARWRTNRRLRKRLRQHPSIAFVCKGNICRSPFADIYLRSRIRSENSPRLDVQSFGLIERVNRQSPELAVAAARSFGIDLSRHRSKLLTPEVVESAGVLFIMDFELYQRVKTQFPAARRKLFFLGVLQNSARAPVEIPDPYGGNPQKFHQVFTQITQSVDNLIRLAK